MRHLLTFLCCFVALVATAQNVTITGRTNKAKELVRLFVYDELITNTGKLVASTNANEKGHFILEARLDNPLPARIFVGLESVDVFLSPHATYDIEIIVPEQDDKVSYFDKEQPTIRIRKATDNGLYRQIVQSEQIINTYLLEHILQIYHSRQARYIDSIQALIHREMPDIQSEIVKSNIRYKLASVRLAISTDHGNKVVKDYFAGKPVLYTQSAYIDLFKELFGSYFNKASYDNHALNDAFATSYAAFSEYLASDPLMRDNPRLAELITIYNLQQMLNADRVTRRFAKAHLEQIKKTTPYGEHKIIISNVFAKRDRLAVDADATDFELTDNEGRPVRLSQYKNDLVLLQFVDGVSPVSERQFNNLKALHAQWLDSVQILTIATKDKMAYYEQQFAEKHYDWPLLNLGNNILLLEAYNVKTFPEYILVKPGTKIGAAPAPAPDQHLEPFVRKLK